MLRTLPEGGALIPALNDDLLHLEAPDAFNAATRQAKHTLCGRTLDRFHTTTQLGFADCAFCVAEATRLMREDEQARELRQVDDEDFCEICDETVVLQASADGCARWWRHKAVLTGERDIVQWPYDHVATVGRGGSWIQGSPQPFSGSAGPEERREEP